MKTRLYLVVLLVLLISALACNLPWVQPQETPPSEQIVVITEVGPEPEPTTVTEIIETEIPIEEPTEAPFACGPQMVPATAFSVEFCYPEQYSDGYMHVMLPANPPSESDHPWDIHPDMIEITLTGYPVDNVYHDPIVRIYPVADFVALFPDVQTSVDILGTMLASQSVNFISVPFYPLFNAAQLIHAQVSYLTFQNGHGVRFITQYSQAAVRISNDGAIYAFSGLTDDGAYLITATMPVNHPLFYPDMDTEPEEGWIAFSSNFETYLNLMEADLSMQTPDSFFPDLTILDEMMASFLIPPNAIP